MIGPPRLQFEHGGCHYVQHPCPNEHHQTQHQQNRIMMNKINKKYINNIILQTIFHAYKLPPQRCKPKLRIFAINLGRVFPCQRHTQLPSGLYRPRFTKQILRSFGAWRYNLTISYQWLFLVPLKGGRCHIIPQLAVYTTYILPSGGLHATYHLLGEPETTIDLINCCACCVIFGMSTTNKNMFETSHQHNPSNMKINPN